jgi:spore germination protein GerM
VLAAVACGGGDAQQTLPAEPPQAPAPPPAEEESEGEAPSQSLSRYTVKAYFPAAGGNGLIGEYREIFQTVTPGDRAKQIVAELIAGPVNSRALPAVPEGTRLRQAYVLDDGTAFLDFSSDLVEGMGGGSMEELLTVYSIVDSVVLNVSEIRRVGILVEGEVIETLNGHMDLRRPLRPNSRLILAGVVGVRPRTVAFPRSGNA